MKTTDFFLKTPSYPMEHCHNGKETIFYQDIIAQMPKDEIMHIQFIHHDVLPPNSSIGVHTHDNPNEEEWYLCIAGSGIMHLNGNDHRITAGDISVCRTGGCHGIFNDRENNLEIIVICAQ